MILTNNCTSRVKVGNTHLCVDISGDMGYGRVTKLEFPLSFVVMRYNANVQL